MLTDAHVAALARQALDLLDPELGVRIDPAAQDDPYRWRTRAWLVFPLLDGRADRSFGIYVDGSSTPADALARLLDGLGESDESQRFWGRAFPACPGHAHPASVAAAGEDVELRCPATGAVVGRIEPVG